MSYVITRDIPIIYSNLRKASKYIPFQSYLFKIPIKKGFIDTLGLFFSCDEEESEEIFIKVNYEKKIYQKKVKSKDIKEDLPIKISIKDFFYEECLISISLKLIKKGKVVDGDFKSNIKVKVNEVNDPCIFIEGSVSEYFEFETPILISIITPIYKVSLDLFKKTVKSVLDQFYEKWEWCLVDDGSNDEELKKFLNELKDDRIKITYLETNSGIVSATNIGLSEATGKFVAFLDHDDLLSPEALLYVALEYNKYPDVDFIYTDEDKVLEDGSFVGAFYKSDWNYNLLLSSMYTCHFSVYRRSLILALDGLRQGFDGSQDYDLVLRVVENTRKIRHIPLILYHWRITENSTSKSITNKPEARINGLRALEDHLKRIGREAVVCGSNYPGHYDVRYVLSELPLISIIIPFKDNIFLLRNLLATFKITSYENYKIILVNNNSEKRETFDYLNSIKDKRIKIVEYKSKFNFSKLNNTIVRNYTKNSDFVLFLNNDTEIIHPEWLYNMVQHFVRPRVAVVGAKLLYLDHRIQHAGIFVGINHIAGHSHKYLYDWNPGYFSRPHLTQDITAVTGACMMVRKEDFWKAGGFNPLLATAFNDIDLCLTLRKMNKIIVFTPFSKLYHRESPTRGYDHISDVDFVRSIRYMEEKWDLKNYVDPYYNINLPRNCEGQALR